MADDLEKDQQVNIQGLKGVFLVEAKYSGQIEALSGRWWVWNENGEMHLVQRERITKIKLPRARRFSVLAREKKMIKAADELGKKYNLQLEWDVSRKALKHLLPKDDKKHLLFYNQARLFIKRFQQACGSRDESKEIAEARQLKRENAMVNEARSIQIRFLVEGAPLFLNHLNRKLVENLNMKISSGNIVETIFDEAVDDIQSYLQSKYWSELARILVAMRGFYRDILQRRTFDQMATQLSRNLPEKVLAILGSPAFTSEGQEKDIKLAAEGARLLLAKPGINREYSMEGLKDAIQQLIDVEKSNEFEYLATVRKAKKGPVVRDDALFTIKLEKVSGSFMKTTHTRILYIFPEFIAWASVDKPTKTIRHLPLDEIAMEYVKKPNAFILKHKLKKFEFICNNSRDFRKWVKAFKGTKAKSPRTPLDDLVLSNKWKDDEDSDGEDNYNPVSTNRQPKSPSRSKSPSRYNSISIATDQDEDAKTPWTYAAAIAEVARNMEMALEIKDRTWHFKTYKQCFIGSDAVAWMIKNGFAADRDEAVILGNAVLRKGYISHVTKDHNFKDKMLFFRFNHDRINNLTKSKYILHSLPGMAKEDSALWSPVDVKVAWIEGQNGFPVPVLQTRRVGTTTEAKSSQSRRSQVEEYDFDILLAGSYVLPSSDACIFKFKGICLKKNQMGLVKTIHLKCDSVESRNDWVESVRSVIATEQSRFNFASQLLQFHETRLGAFIKLACGSEEKLSEVLSADPLEQCVPFCKDNIKFLQTLRNEVHQAILAWLRYLLKSNWDSTYGYALNIVNFASISAQPSSSYVRAGESVEEL